MFGDFSLLNIHIPGGQSMTKTNENLLKHDFNSFPKGILL